MLLLPALAARGGKRRGGLPPHRGEAPDSGARWRIKVAGSGRSSNVAPPPEPFEQVGVISFQSATPPPEPVEQVGVIFFQSGGAAVVPPPTMSTNEPLQLKWRDALCRDEMY